jgi:chemotaxis-related protein WspD
VNQRPPFTQPNEPRVADVPATAAVGETPSAREIAGTEAPVSSESFISRAEPVHDCWNLIGVSGNGSCRELLRFVHCRNCPVYSTAAVQLLDRPVTEERRREWTGYYGQERQLTTPARISLVIFRLGGEWLALPTLAFQEVAERRRLHSLPHRRGGVVLGLVNVRGELLVCASLDRVLGLASPPGGEDGRWRMADGPTDRRDLPSSIFHPPSSAREIPRTESPASSEGFISRTESVGRCFYDRLLVAVWDGKRLVFPVDEVHGVQRVHEAELREPPATVAQATQRCSRGVFAWRQRTVGVLDADLLFATLNRQLA